MTMFKATIRRPIMTTDIVEGVLAVNKPKGISSAQVIRELQKYFDTSKVFAPWLAAEKQRRNRESQYQRGRRRDKRAPQVKIGHGGTLDPMATGVLICGIGSGTKALQGFINCTKTYETVILFGAATDTYDVMGKVLRKAPYEHVTKEYVLEALGKFRGKILQTPPIFSALWMDGKRLYDYAREGKELPRQIEPRPVEVHELELVEWLPGGGHSHQWPTQEASNEEKEFARKVLNFDTKNEEHASQSSSDELSEKKEEQNLHNEYSGPQLSDGYSKRKWSLVDDLENTVAEEHELKHHKLMDQPATAVTLPQEIDVNQAISVGLGIAENENRPAPPAARVRMTVTSGFYVRSLCHDLGQAVGSLAIMGDLVRTRQAEFEVDKNLLEFRDLESGEDVWGPIVRNMLSSENANGGSLDQSVVTSDK